MKRLLLRLLASLGLLLAAAVVGFVIWGSTPQAATDSALQALVSDSAVTVTTGEWITFSPAGQAPQAGLIVYPGGHVDPRAYAPLARQIAAQGYRVVIVPMPLALAVMAPNRALQVMAQDPSIETWAIGGHSLGGAMSARFAYTHPDAVDGLVLWAAYPASTDDLSGYDLVVTSIYGTLDGLSTGNKIDASRPLLPAGTRLGSDRRRQPRSIRRLRPAGRRQPVDDHGRGTACTGGRSNGDPARSHGEGGSIERWLRCTSGTTGPALAPGAVAQASKEMRWPFRGPCRS